MLSHLLNEIFFFRLVPMNVYYRPKNNAVNQYTVLREDLNYNLCIGNVLLMFSCLADYIL